MLRKIMNVIAKELEVPYERICEIFEFEFIKKPKENVYLKYKGVFIDSWGTITSSREEIPVLVGTLNIFIDQDGEIYLSSRPRVKTHKLIGQIEFKLYQCYFPRMNYLDYIKIGLLIPQD